MHGRMVAWSHGRCTQTRLEDWARRGSGEVEYGSERGVRQGEGRRRRAEGLGQREEREKQRGAG
eukprot:1789836-Pleurochrysis_carterae.AAC.1